MSPDLEDLLVRMVWVADVGVLVSGLELGALYCLDVEAPAMDYNK